MNVDVERFGVAVDRYVGRGVWSGGGVEDLPTYSVHADHGGAGLGGGVVGVGGAGDGDPVSGAGGAHHRAQGGGAPCDGECLGRSVGRVRTGRVLEDVTPELHIVIALLREEKFHMKTMKSSNSLILLNIRILKFQCQNIEI